MKIRTVLFAGLGTIVALAVVDAAVSFITVRSATAAPLALDGIDALDLRGDASKITVTTRPDAPLRAELSGRRSGWGAVWHSSWFSDRACAPEGSMRLEGRTLIVDTGNRSHGLFWSDWSDCTPDLTVNLAPNSQVTIAQAATSASLTGSFSRVDVNAEAGDIAFDGHADALAMSGAALRVRLAYRSVANNEIIRLTGQMMDASLKFLVPTAISYLVEAGASLVDSALPNTPGAKPEIIVKGEMLRLKVE